MTKRLGFIILLLVTQFPIAQNLAPNSTGSFTYTPASPLNTQPVEVFYHIPNGDITSMPIVLSFHGANRNADDYRDYWISMANANGFMVFAPEFSSENYPGLGDNYLMGNVFEDGDNPSPETYNPANEWTFSILDPLFEYIKVDISGAQQTYNGWGHSGGAQFLHRFVMYMPNSNLDIAVCSNAGWYTVPEFSVDYPYGIQNGQLPTTDLTNAFSKKMIVHLGQNDTDPNSAGLRHNDDVDNQQGLFRLERGLYFFNTSQVTAQGLTVPFNWEKHEVSDVGHQAQLMANNALQYVLMSSLAIDKYKFNPEIVFYPNPMQDSFWFNNSKYRFEKIKIYSILGTQVLEVDFLDFNSNQQVNISHLENGIYFIYANNNVFRILKH